MQAYENCVLSKIVSYRWIFDEVCFNSKLDMTTTDVASYISMPNPTLLSSFS